MSEQIEPPPIESLAAAVEQINARLRRLNRVLRLRVDAGTGVATAEVRDATTGRVLQYIPGTDIVHLAEMLCGRAHGQNALLDLIA